MAELEANITRSRKSYNIYQKEQKALFLYLLRFKFLKAKPAAERAGISPRTAQGREEHKHLLINLFDEQPQATRQDAVDAQLETKEDQS
ncbi:hypothetical protein HMPREF1544_03715 [Mucor circinelloides 1006PhL]|uniref:Uncharacterized protein n=1 Tax=Mucor circinelloides f. circinelloides (strain 1006PhL) TaxID=1220926 RepID=S2JHX1_MUCC1|nr:hypothetical protein HMPREF1544_03715 [Mucor circinelloides 1006PhL]